MARNDVALLRLMPWVFVLIWSTGFVVARYGMPHAPPFGFLCIRYALSLLCFALWIALARAAWPSGPQQLWHLAVSGVLMHAGYLGGVWAAIKQGIGAGTVALLVGLQPVLTAVWIGLVSRRPADAAGLQARHWLGLLFGLVGLGLVVWPKTGIGEVTLTNLSLGTLALFSITAGTLYQKHFLAPTDVRTANAVQLFAALLISLPIALVEAEAIDWHPQLLGALAWSVLVLTLGGSSLLYLLIQRGVATRVTSLMYLVPPCTACLAWILFGEAVTLAMWAGMALTVAGVILVMHTAKPSQSKLRSET
ncbi:MAG: DMT family transporter [Burkholderiaceae bacterium]